MSSLQPVTASESNVHVSPPSFSVAMRGYDRKQVQSFVDELYRRLAAQRRHAAATERAMTHMRQEIAAMKNQPPPSFEDLGSEAGRVLEQAGNSARLLIEEAKGRGDAIVHNAETDAAHLIRSAELHAAELEQAASAKVGEAKRESARILAEAEAEAGRLRARGEAHVKSALERARADAEGIRQKVLQDHAGMVAETDRLQESLSWVLEYFAGLRSYLDTLLGDAAAGRQVQADATNGHSELGGPELAVQPASPAN
jgi:peptidoglycan DL-endopeptidase RipA